MMREQKTHGEGTQLTQVRHDETRDDKLNALNMEHMTFTIKQEMKERKTERGVEEQQMRGDMMDRGTQRSHKHRETQGKDTRGNLIIQKLNRVCKKLQNRITMTINEPENKP